jgi:hypothetical protein
MAIQLFIRQYFPPQQQSQLVKKVDDYSTEPTESANEEEDVTTSLPHSTNKKQKKESHSDIEEELEAVVNNKAPTQDQKIDIECLKKSQTGITILNVSVINIIDITT